MNKNLPVRKAISRKQELPLTKGQFSFFMELMTACAVFLFSVTTAGVLAVNSMIGKWNDGAMNTFTVQIMPVTNNETSSDTESEVEKTVNFLRKQNGIESVTPFDDEMHEKLIRPWLGDGIDIKSLAMPRLIDVQIARRNNIDFDALSEKLTEISEYASLDSHKLWLSKLIKFANSLKTLALIVLGIVMTICAVSIFYATKTSLGLHKDIIEILHLMGAKDTYIAQQYARRAAILSIIAGGCGFVVAIVVIWGIARISQDLEGGIIKEAGLTLFSWFKILLIPFMISGIATLTSYLAVKNTLEKTM